MPEPVEEGVEPRPEGTAQEGNAVEEMEAPHQAADVTALEALPQEAPAPESVEELRQRLEKAQAEANEYLDGWQRSRAEFANFKKRIEREQDETRQKVAGEILGRYLEILDDLNRALKERPVGPDVAPWAAGIELVQRKLQLILETEGVEPIPAQGLMFDPNMHEAVTFEHSDDHKSGHVIDVIREGYRLGERILRPAQVRVAK